MYHIYFSCLSSVLVRTYTLHIIRLGLLIQHSHTDSRLDAKDTCENATRPWGLTLIM